MLTINLGSPITTRQICFFSVIISITFSIVVFQQHDLINKDGALYVQTAELLQNGLISDAFKHYNWPFMPLLIAVIDNISGAGLENSAYIVNSLLDAAMLVAFILIVKELGGDVRAQIAAVVVILSLAYLNENRADVIRGHGYWSCYLFSLLLYLKFYRSPGLWLGLGWSLAMLVGALFRVEGFVIWMALPLVMFLRSETPIVDKFIYLLQSYALQIFIAFLVSIYVLTVNNDFVLASKLSQITKMLEYLLNRVGEDMGGRVLALSADVLHSRYSDDYAIPALAAIFLLILGDKIITAITIPYAGLYLFPSLRNSLQKLDSGPVKVLTWAIIINLVILSVFLSRHFFLSTRWAIPAALTLLLFVPFMLIKALDSWVKLTGPWSSPVKITYIVFSLFIVYGVLDGLISTSPPKTYIKDAGIWIKNNIDKDGTLYTNNNRISYYSGRKIKRGRGKKAFRDSLLRFDYMAIQFDDDDVSMSAKMQKWSRCLIEINRFSGPKAIVAVFQVRRDVCNTAKLHNQE